MTMSHQVLRILLLNIKRLKHQARNYNYKGRSGRGGGPRVRAGGRVERFSWSK